MNLAVYPAMADAVPRTADLHQLGRLGLTGHSLFGLLPRFVVVHTVLAQRH